MKDLADGLHENTQTVLIGDQFCSSSRKFLAFSFVRFPRRHDYSSRHHFNPMLSFNFPPVAPEQGRIGSKAGL